MRFKEFSADAREIPTGVGLQVYNLKTYARKNYLDIDSDAMYRRAEIYIFNDLSSDPNG